MKSWKPIFHFFYSCFSVPEYRHLANRNSNVSFHCQDLISNSPYGLLYNSCGVSLKNLAVGSTNDSPLVISILTTCLPNNFLQEILFGSLVGVKGLKLIKDLEEKFSIVFVGALVGMGKKLLNTEK